MREAANVRLQKPAICLPVGSRDKVEFLEPSGFAVDFYKEPSNDLSTQDFVPVEDPWIDADGELPSFGGRFWEYIKARHHGAKEMLENQSDRLASVSYSDRYLFSPLSLAFAVSVD